MSDTRCANPGYQLDVDEMTLEYLVYDTLKTCIDEWDPEYRERSEDEKTRSLKPSKAPTLLSILDSELQRSIRIRLTLTLRSSHHLPLQI
jgi:hypothetical protein